MGHVPPQGLPPLVHWRGHGRDGVHGGRVEHERPRFRVPAVPGRHRRGGGRHDVSTPTHFLHLCRTPASFPCITTLLLLLGVVHRGAPHACIPLKVRITNALL